MRWAGAGDVNCRNPCGVAAVGAALDDGRGPPSAEQLLQETSAAPPRAGSETFEGSVTGPKDPRVCPTPLRVPD
jgi:hypothetical protein